MGADYINYINIFRIIAKTGDSYLMYKGENGYVLLNYIVSKVSDNYVAIAFVINLMLFIPLYIYLKKTVSPENWGLCVLVFALNPYMYVQTTFNILRQCCAIGLVMMAVLCLIQLKRNELVANLEFICLVILASKFHKSAIAMLLILIIKHIKWTSNKWKFMTVIFLAIKILGSRSLLNILTIIFGYEKFVDRVASLLDNPIYILGVFLFVWWLCTRYDSLVNNSIDKFFVDIFMFTMCTLFIAVDNEAVYRMRIYMLFISLPAIPIVFGKNIQKNSKRFGINRCMKVCYISYNMCFYIAYFVYLYLNNVTAYVPFKFYSVI
jgi:hypothetical protein